MVDMAVMLGAPKERAETELKESLLFEIELANVSTGRGGGGATSPVLSPRQAGALKSDTLVVCWLIHVHTACRTHVCDCFVKNVGRIPHRTPVLTGAGYVRLSTGGLRWRWCSDTGYRYDSYVRQAALCIREIHCVNSRYIHSTHGDLSGLYNAMYNFDV